jgi:hypothetical protein
LSRLRIFPIVEGHGEEGAVRILLERIWTELLGQEYVEVSRPLRRPRSKLLPIGETVNRKELESALELAVLKLANQESSDPGLILLLLDADDSAPCRLAPTLLAEARTIRPDADIACVLATVEYETWFVAAAESLAEYLDLSNDGEIPSNPEEQGLRKGWIDSRFRQARYSETVDQPKLTRWMDLHLCRRRSPSFDKLCRELEKRIPAP